MNKDKILKAGKIASDVKKWIRPQIKKDVPLVELAEKIEGKIVELGGKPAFPASLSIDDVAAHCVPGHGDETLAHGLLKVDFGVHVEGSISDTAFSVDLENSDKNKKLIEAAEKALENAIKKVKLGVTTSQIGEIISETIESLDANPIINLTGHSIEEYDLHSGITIPNFNDKRNVELTEGLYAIEPFATSGNGKVYDGKPSGIYVLQTPKNTRSPIAREVIDFVMDEYNTLPFCSRWLVKKFGTRALLGLRQLTQQGIIHEYEQLIEASHAPVAQAEQTILIEKDKVIVTTE